MGNTCAMQLVTIEDIQAAGELIRPFIVRTPLVPAGWADDDRPLWIKPESLQSIGAFKARGAFNAIGHLDESVRTRGVVAYSSGNHAQAVAYAAAVYGIPAHIVMPEESPGDSFLESVAQELEHRFGIAHVTLQIERGDGGECLLAPVTVV